MIPQTPTTAQPPASSELPAFLAALDAGYLPGVPSQQAVEIDSAAAAECPCPQCRQRGRDYLPLMKGASYRAWAVCPCGCIEEF